MKKNKKNIRNKYSSKRYLYIGGFKIGKADELCFQEKNYNSTYGELTKSGACQLFANYPMRNNVICDMEVERVTYCIMYCRCFLL